MFTPVNITPLPRRGSPLALILRGILVASVAMALLATLAAYPSGSWRDAGSPYGIPWEETQGAPLLSGRPSLDPVGFSPSRYLPALERGSPGGQAVALSDLESQMREAINGERTKAGLPPLAIDERLVGLARERSQDMVARGYFSHTTPEGKMVFDFLDARGVYSPYAGENLARTNAGANQAVQMVVSGFMNSPTHRKNVLNSHYTHLGVGEATSPEGMKYFTLVFIGLPPGPWPKSPAPRRARPGYQDGLASTGAG